MDDGVQQQTQRIDENMPLLALDQLARIEPVRIDAAPPFFGALHALTIDDGGGGARFSFRLVAAFDVKRVMNAIQHAIAPPPNEIVVHRAARRKILRKVAPLATGAQDYITPFMTARMSVRRLPPPGFAGGRSGSTYAHSSSVRSLGTSGDRDCISVGSHAS